jgi:hypothetical protein
MRNGKLENEEAAEGYAPRTVQIRRELPDVESEVQRDYVASYGQGMRPNVLLAQEQPLLMARDPVRVTTTVKERFRLLAPDVDQERISNLQTELELVKADLERAPPQSRAIERIRVELDSVRSDLERPSRARSFSPTPRMQAIMPASPMIAVAPAAPWPPPPLPPLAADVAFRLSSLEARGPSPEDLACDRLLEQQLEKLRALQAYVGQQQALQEQLRLRNSDWSRRMEMLEQRSREQEAEFERGIREAVSLVQERGRKDVEQLQAEIQAARSTTMALREEAERRSQEEINNLERQLQAAIMDSSVRRQSVSMLDSDLNRQRVEAARLNEEIARVEREGKAISSEILMVKQSVNDDQDVSTIRLAVRQENLILEDLTKKLREIEVACGVVESDVGHMRKANDQRGQEAAKLRKSIKEEKAQIQSLKAQRDAVTKIDLTQERKSFMERRSFTEFMEQRQSVGSLAQSDQRTVVKEVIDISIEESSNSESEASETYNLKMDRIASER